MKGRHEYLICWVVDVGLENVHMHKKIVLDRLMNGDAIDKIVAELLEEAKKRYNTSSVRIALASFGYLGYRCFNPKDGTEFPTCGC